MSTKKLKKIKSTLTSEATSKYLKLASNKLKLPPPSVELALKINALFDYDPDVYTTFSYKKSLLTVYVKGSAKADALNWLLGHKVHDIVTKFNVKVIRVLENGEFEELPSPSYDITIAGKIKFLKDALNGIGFDAEFNSVTDPIMQVTFNFLEVEPVAISVKIDNLGNPYGYATYLAADLVNEAFDTDGIHVTTYARDPSNVEG